MSDGIPWATARAAVRGWIVSGAAPDIAADHVIWTGQQHAIPNGMYVTIGVLEELDLGEDVQSYVTELDNSITEHAIGPRLVWLVVTVYGSISQTDATVPYRIASRIRSRLGLSSVADAMDAGNVGVMTWSSVTTPGRGLNSTTFEPRATFNVQVSLVSDVSGTVDVIQTVNTSSTIT